MIGNDMENQIDIVYTSLRISLMDVDCDIITLTPQKDGSIQISKSISVEKQELKQLRSKNKNNEV